MQKNVTNILFCHQHLKMVTIIKSPTSRCHQQRCRIFVTNRFVTSACSGQSVTSRLRSITSWHMFVTVNVSFNAYACHEVHFVAKFIWSRTYVPKSSRREVTFHPPTSLSPKLFFIAGNPTIFEFTVNKCLLITKLFVVLWIQTFDWVSSPHYMRLKL